MDFGINLATSADSWKVVKRAEELGYKVLVSEGTPIVLKIIVSGHVDGVADVVEVVGEGASVRLGRSILVDTQTRAKAYVGNGLVCVSCHLDQGRAAYAAPLAGLTGVFPEYRARRGSVESLEQRINDCFLRSMNGKPLPPGSPEMIGLLSYTAWLSQGVPTGVEVVGRGFRDITAPSPPDPARGKSLFAAKCAACHGVDGQGLRGAGDALRIDCAAALATASDTPRMALAPRRALLSVPSRSISVRSIRPCSVASSPTPVT